MTRYSIDKDFIVANLGRRIESHYPSASVQIGVGNTNADIVVVQPHVKMPDRDAITGALKNFGMLNNAYRATSQIVDHGSPHVQDPCMMKQVYRYYLKELIEIIDPLIVIACGPDALSVLKKRRIRLEEDELWFDKRTGKKFIVSDLPQCTFFATLNPTTYGFARAPEYLKQQGKTEWTKLAKIYQTLKKKQEKERWAYD